MPQRFIPTRSAVGRWGTSHLLAVSLAAACAAGCARCGGEEEEKGEIVVFSGAAAQPVVDEAARLFGAREGGRVIAEYSGSGSVLSQMKMSRRGDVYVAGSPDFMSKAMREGVVDPATVEILAYLVPAIVVRKGNPLGIRGLDDLARPGVRLVIGEPRTVCVGLYAVELLEKAGMLNKVRGNVVTLAESCGKVSAAVQMNAADAAIGWSVFERWSPDDVEAVLLPPGKVPRIAYVAAGVSTFSARKEAAGRFVALLAGAEGKKLFAAHGYAAAEEEARALAPGAVVGGDYVLPPDFFSPVAIPGQKQ